LSQMTQGQPDPTLSAPADLDSLLSHFAAAEPDAPQAQVSPTDRVAVEQAPADEFGDPDADFLGEGI
jgi:hypothetical protein